jgi:alpha-ketoglutarate-dependent taurine dioxygenase
MSARPSIPPPEAWHASDVEGSTQWRFALDARAYDVMIDAARDAAARDLDVFQVNRGSFPLAGTQALFAGIHQQVEAGFGFALVSGLPVDRLDEHERRLLACGLAAQIGDVVIQNHEGQRIVDVRDDGVPYSHTSRGYRSNVLLPFHSDGAGMFMLCCLGQAAEGGETVIASASALYNTILAERPDVLPVLERGYYHHRRGQHDPAEPPLSPQRIPVFAVHDDLLHCCYNRNPIEWVEHEGLQLDASEREALDVVDAILGRREMQLRLGLAAGEALFVNNFTVLHSRTGYRDAPGRRRHLLRVWMDDPEGRRIGQTLLDLYVPGTSRFARVHGGAGVARG